VLADKSRTKHPGNTKIGGKVVHPTGNNAHQFQGQRSKVKVTRPTNAETGSASYFPNGNAYTNFKLGTQTDHEDPVCVFRTRCMYTCTHQKHQVDDDKEAFGADNLQPFTSPATGAC